MRYKDFYEISPQYQPLLSLLSLPIPITAVEFVYHLVTMARMPVRFKYIGDGFVRAEILTPEGWKQLNSRSFYNPKHYEYYLKYLEALYHEMEDLQNSSSKP